ncbi:MAG: PAS domain-containing protein [Synechococcaceae cyanobacterium RL_1_2]|nr:PAS domain-containing protein [Synechococcaceae cyanobacterium RL_1_2]
MADALFVTTPKGIIKTANPAVSRLLGYGVKELINQPIAKFIKNEQFLHSLTEQANATPQELICHTQDGRKLIIAFSKSTIPGEQQENIVYIGRDITRQVIYLHRIKTLNQSLQQKTEELEQVNTELEAFSRTVSHDLRGPLSHISLFNQLMMVEYASQLDDQGRDYMTEIKEGCHRMNQLISDLLQLSRAKFQELNLDLIDLSDLGEDILFRLKRKERDRPVQIRIQPSIEVVGDYGLIKVVLENLLNNAWKYTSKETAPKIHLGIVSHVNHSFEQVKVLTQSQPGKIYFVRDNGAGFDMAKAQDLFAPFKRLHSQEEFEGTGVGLATVKRIIERHQGNIWAESIPGQGTTFYFTLNCSL